MCRMTMFKKYKGFTGKQGLARKWPEPVERRVTPVTLLSTGSGHFRAKTCFPVNPLHFLNIVILHISAYEDGTE
jgi:hypothetical protein